MDENPTLSEVVFSAISDWMGDSGLATGFLLVVPTIEAEGPVCIRVVTPDTQPYHVSLGLAEFAGEYIRDDIRTAFLSDFTGGDE